MEVEGVRYLVRRRRKGRAMPWSARVTGKERIDGILRVTVEYTDGRVSFKETYKSAGGNLDNWIEKTAKSKIARLNNLDNEAIIIGPVQEPLPDKTQEEIDWCKALHTLRRLDILIVSGVITKADPRYQALVSLVQAGLDKYWHLFEEGGV